MNLFQMCRVVLTFRLLILVLAESFLHRMNRERNTVKAKNPSHAHLGGRNKARCWAGLHKNKILHRRIILEFVTAVGIGTL